MVNNAGLLNSNWSYHRTYNMFFFARQQKWSGNMSHA